MYSITFNPFRPFRSITSHGYEIHNLDICCAKSTFVLASHPSLPPKSVWFTPNSFILEKTKQLLTNYFFRSSQDLIEVFIIFPHLPFLLAVESPFVAPWTEVVPHFWSGWFLLCVAFLLSLYIYNREWERETRSGCTMNFYMLWHNDVA